MSIRGYTIFLDEYDDVIAVICRAYNGHYELHGVELSNFLSEQEGKYDDFFDLSFKTLSFFINRGQKITFSRKRDAFDDPHAFVYMVWDDFDGIKFKTFPSFADEKRYDGTPEGFIDFLKNNSE